MERNIHIVLESEFHIDHMKTEIVKVFSDYSEAEKYLSDNSKKDLLIESWIVEFKD